MIDIHNHLLYGCDDGTKNFEESLQLLKDAAREGVSKVIITTHYICNSKFCIEKEELEERFLRFVSKCKENGITMNFYLGNELMIDKYLSILLEDGKISTLAGSKYILVEFPFEIYSEDFDEILYDLRCLGYRIIIAHPERYKYVQNNPNFCLRWLNEGDLLQCNQASLDEFHGIVNKMIEHNFVSFIASDAHNRERPLSLKKAYNQIKQKFGEKIAKDLFENNAQSVIENGDISNTSFKPFKKIKLFDLFKK